MLLQGVVVVVVFNVGRVLANDLMAIVITRALSSMAKQQTVCPEFYSSSQHNERPFVGKRK